MLLSHFFHNWERRLAGLTTDRVVRPFDWGLDWLDLQDDPAAARDPLSAIQRYVDGVMADTAAFYAITPAPSYDFEESTGTLRFESAMRTPHPANNTVACRFFPAQDGDRKCAVLVLPQWNADANGHVGLCQLLARFGMSALRLSLPYHDSRMPPELHRADYIVSANVGRTLQVCRQAVLDARRAIAWLADQGFTQIGILGTSLGSCLASLTAAHEPLIKAAALNHISPYFADVVWEGLSTIHVRQGLEGHITLDALRQLWLPIGPQPYLDRLRRTKTLLVYARYDLTFPVGLSRRLVNDFRSMGLPHEVAVLPCGHYSTGLSPFKWLDGYVLTKFLRSSLRAA
jgi:Alpha/beta hydrolase domain containing 18